MDCWRVISALALLVGVGLCVHADEPQQKYLLRYQFQPDQVLRWTVVQSLTQVTSIRGTTDRIESTCRSTKVWKVRDVDAKEKTTGNATLLYSVADVVMFKRQTDFPDSSYNSQTDTVVPPVFRDVAALLNRPLAELTFTPRGEVVKRVALAEYVAGTEENRIVVPLPKDEVRLGETWFAPHEITIARPNGRVRKLAARHRFTLESVKTGIATVSFNTQVLTPIGNPKDEMEVLDQLTSGTLRLDLDTGQMVSHRSSIDRTIVGFEGGGSSVTYKRLLDECCCGFKTCAICSPKIKSDD